MKSLVMLFDFEKGDFIKGSLYTLSPKKALICAVMQYKGDYNTANYPADLNGIYKSPSIKDRILFDVSENLTFCAQVA